MNDYYYYNLICPFIPIKERAVCSRKDRHLLNLKNNKQRILNAYIVLHRGSPCYRYCICRYFAKDDILDFYERN
tara:strand:- start:247 stop:468 length:222 start_codon:yes stop_codon:yes gene_type:complete